ncbi:hypothetical protein ACIA5E_26885 [Nocardia asteroides]|uniref:hypothetical protein n=1 Tax=Nocardia asteroides TaxID=1824 RepID=UPI00379D9C95
MLSKLTKAVAQSAAKIAAIRAPLDWEREVEQWDHHGALHDLMLHGYQHDKGRTPEKGWRQEYGRSTSEGPRRHDDALVKVVAFGRQVVEHTVETKAGGVRIDDGVRQLRKERELLATGRTRVSEYVIRAARPPHPEVMKAARQLAEDYPGRFVLVELDEPEFHRVVDLGRPIVQQREMVKLGHLVGKLRRSPELRTAPRAVRGFLREISRAERKGEPLGLEVLVGARIELAQMLEVDHETTQRMDKIAREAAGLKLKESRIVEAVQAKQRQTRAARLSQLVARVDRQIVRAAATAVRARVPRGAGKAVELGRVAGADPAQAAMAKSLQQMAGLIAKRAADDRAQKERELVAGLVLPTPMHHEVVHKVLEQQRDNPGPVTVAHVREAERDVRGRAQEHALQAHAREVRERENREVMERVAAAYNKRLEQAAREQRAGRGVDEAADAAHARQTERLARDLRMDAGRMVEQGIDAQAVAELARGNARVDEGARAYVVEVGDRTIYVGAESQEAVLALQIQRVESGMDLASVQARQLMEHVHTTTVVAQSREALERQRTELERKRQRGRERHGTGRTVGDRGKDAPGRGMERGR